MKSNKRATKKILRGLQARGKVGVTYFEYKENKDMLRDEHARVKTSVKPLRF